MMISYGIIHLLCNSSQERTLDEQQKLIRGIMKRDEKRRKRIEAAGIDYECPEFVRFNSLYFLLYIVGYSLNAMHYQVIIIIALVVIFWYPNDMSTYF